MSQENVEIVRRSWEAWTKGDLDAVLDTFDPAVEWDTSNFEGWPEDEVYTGREGVRRFFEEWLSSWEQYEAGPETFFDVDDDQVLVLCWQRGLGRESRVPVEMEWAQLCALRRGLIVRLDNYSSRQAALEAAGLAG